MNESSSKLAQALTTLKSIQDNGHQVIRSNQLSRTERETLIKYGFLRSIMRGWYAASQPDEKPGDSTPWYTCFWSFCAEYLDNRFGQQWALSPEQSLALHIGDRTIPTQLLVRSPKATNNSIELPHKTSILEVQLKLPEQAHLTTLNGLRVYTLAAALVYSSPKNYTQHPIQMRTALSMVSDASDILKVLIVGGHSAIAGRLAGAFRNIGRAIIADSIINGMAANDYRVSETDPFTDKILIDFGRRQLSPYSNRIRLMWSEMRNDVINLFPEPSSKPADINNILEKIDEQFVSDAYHSLSIEGYRVTEELIELIHSGKWDPNTSGESKKHLDAMAAKGYWNAFQKVKETITSVLNGANPGEALERVHGDWYLALFSPSVAAGIVSQQDLAGYRSGPVFIRNSMHTPPDKEAVRDMMPTLFDLLIEEESVAVRAVLGHFIFVFIHPYFDGNGRIGRFIMNLMLASGGYPWTVVPVEKRSDYMHALEAASVKQNIKPFAEFLGRLVNTSD
jgi:hypothetical protein